MIKTSIKGIQQVQNELAKELKKYKEAPSVVVGIRGEAGTVESGDITMAQLGAIHEFGADVNHPGGTSYGYKSEKDASKGKVSFLKKGEGYAELGVTGPHKIKIPERAFLRPGVELAVPNITKAVIKFLPIDGIEKTLGKVGQIAQASVQNYMVDLKTPPNAPSTIAKKKSSNPLIDTGALVGSITYAVTSEPLEEGL